MFTDSLLESSRRRPSPRRSLSLLTSIAIEALVIAVLVAIPIWHPDVLAAVTPHEIYEVPYLPSNPDAPPNAHPSHGGGGGPHYSNVPAPISRPDPHGLYFGPARPQSNDDSVVCATCLPGPVGPSTGFNLFPPNARPIMPAPPRQTPIVVSHYDPGSIIRRVMPEYPAMARLARVQGDVVLQAVITRAGTIERLTAVSGNPLLVSAARDAVRQWRFRPYMLNGQAVEIETTITVNFRLDDDGGAL
jgi:periplasmic protein TonB